MNITVRPQTQPPATTEMPAWLTLLLATACGLIAANVYYAQPLVGPISAALGLSPHAAGLIVTMTQLGYGVGLWKLALRLQPTTAIGRPE